MPSDAKTLVRAAARLALGLVAALLTAGCFSTPTPLAPIIDGTVGVPHHGVITRAVPLPRQGKGYKLLRKNGVHWGTARLISAIENAAREVTQARPGGAPLVIGDLSARFGGATSGHRSHRTGRDVDLLLYALTPDGRSVTSPGFIEFGPDGLAATEDGDFFRIDIDRQWLLIKAFLSAPNESIQWMFIARWLEALVIEHARARDEDPELIWHAETVLLQPGDSSAHADHIHLRIACSPEEAVRGCLGGGPYWPWIAPLPQLVPLPDHELAAAIIGDLLPGAPSAEAAASP